MSSPQPLRLFLDSNVLTGGLPTAQAVAQARSSALSQNSLSSVSNYLRFKVGT